MSTVSLDDLTEPQAPDEGQAAAEPPPILELIDVRKTYATGAVEVEALRGIDLVVAEGDYLAVMGPRDQGSRP